MPDYLYLMHRLPDGADAVDWDPYLARLREADRLLGGSAIGTGVSVLKSGSPPGITEHLTGFIRIHAADIAEAKALLAGNPVFERGGVVEIRELPPVIEPRRQLAIPRERHSMEDTKRFENAALDDTVFANCSMRRSQFNDVCLSKSAFVNVDASGSRLENVNLSGVSITDANIDGLTIFGHDIQALIRAEIARGR